MHETKYALIQRYGLTCMLCGKHFPYRQIQWHHIKPKYVSKRANKPPDDSIENGSLLCLDCHARIHEYGWWDDEYQLLTEIILEYKENN
jgi:5-methylcytosine-specific restriction endonuclease McrA